MRTKVFFSLWLELAPSPPPLLAPSIGIKIERIKLGEMKGISLLDHMGMKGKMLIPVTTEVVAI
jgi:hypothetical protein